MVEPLGAYARVYDRGDAAAAAAAAAGYGGFCGFDRGRGGGRSVCKPSVKGTCVRALADVAGYGGFCPPRPPSPCRMGRQESKYFNLSASPPSDLIALFLVVKTVLLILEIVAIGIQLW